MDHFSDAVFNQKTKTHLLHHLNPTSIDAHILSQLAHLQHSIIDAYRSFKFKSVHQLLYDFCNDELSSFYCSAIKDRLYCDKKDSERRLQTQLTLWILIEGLCELIAPIIPHTAEEAYGALLGSHDSKPGSHKSEDSKSGHAIHLRTITPINVTSSDKWSTVLSERNNVLKALETQKDHGLDNPLDAGIRISHQDILTDFNDDLVDIFGVSRVYLVDTPSILEVIDLRDKPRCERSWRRDETVKKRSEGIYLSDRDADAIDS